MPTMCRLHSVLTSMSELQIRGYWPAALTVLVAAQIVCLAVVSASVPVAPLIGLILVVEGYACWVAWRCLNPPKRLFLGEKHLVLCDRHGHRLLTLDQPRGYASPVFVSIRLSLVSGIGVFAHQLSETDYGRLLRWMRGYSG